MGTYRCDNFVPSHINTAIVSGTNVEGEFIELFGAVGVSVQCTASGGASGTLYIAGSNQPGPKGMWVDVATQPVSPDQTILMTSSLADNLVAMHKMKCRFVPATAGNLQVSVNVRRTTY